MNKYVLVPDSFKGTMTSAQVCDIMAGAIRRREPDADIVSIPVADGGEGSVDAFLAAVGGRRVTARVQGPFGEEMEAFYGLLKDGRTAVVEMAACAGLPLAVGRLNPRHATTYGVGQLMLHAAQHGCTRIILGLGGSATNDFGAGAAAAMGIRFTDGDGNAFVPVGESLSRIAAIDNTGLHAALRAAEIVVMCDIDNPLYGENGAAYVFAPQKGADATTVELLDGQLRAVAGTVQAQLGVDVSWLPGAGAAGGMGGGMVAFLGARLQMGIETVLDVVDFATKAQNARFVFTGEGKLDSQSMRGKVVLGVARRAQKLGVPVVAVVGDIEDGIEDIYAQGVTGVFSINRLAVPFSEAKQRSQRDMALTMDNLMRFVNSLS